MKTVHHRIKTVLKGIAVLLLSGMLSSRNIQAQNVGIGASSFTPDPQSMLEVQSTSKGILVPRMTDAQRTAISPTAGSDYGLLVYQTNTVSSSNAAGYWYWNGTSWTSLSTGNNWSLTGNAGTSATNNFVGTTDANDLALRTNNTERVRINASTGYVGIGTNSPSQMLSVWQGMNVDQENVNNGNLNNALRFGSGNGVGIASRRLAGANQYGLDFYTNSSNRMCIAYSTGYVGIGTTSPSQMLTVAEGLNIDDNNANNGSLTNALRFGNSASDEGIGSKRTAGGNQWGLDFYTAGNNRMCITSGGKVGIGTTSPSATKLDVYDPSSSTARVALFKNSSATGTEVQIGSVEYFHDFVSSTDFNGGSNFSVNLNASASYDLQIGGTGTAAKPGGGSWANSSDSRLKEDVHAFKDGLNTIREIKPVYYKYNGKAGLPQNYYVGVLAQEMKEAAPYMVSTYEYLPSDVPLEEAASKIETYYCVDNSALAYVTVNALKELDNKTRKLETAVNHSSDFGVVTMKASETFVPFSDDFRNLLAGNSIPVITVTPVNKALPLTVEEVSALGFIIKTDAALSVPLTVNWMAMAKINLKVAADAPDYSAEERNEMLQKVQLKPAKIKLQRELNEIQSRKLPNTPQNGSIK